MVGSWLNKIAEKVYSFDRLVLRILTLDLRNGNAGMVKCLFFFPCIFPVAVFLACLRSLGGGCLIVYLKGFGRC